MGKSSPVQCWHNVYLLPALKSPQSTFRYSGRQYRDARTGEICSLIVAFVHFRAATFLGDLLGHPYNTELQQSSLEVTKASFEDLIF